MDKEFLGHRRRGLEEEYFARLNRALRDKLRAAEAADAEPADENRAAQRDAGGDRKTDS